MCDFIVDPQSVGYRLCQGDISERLKTSTSTSASDLSEGISDMSHCSHNSSDSDSSEENSFSNKQGHPERSSTGIFTCKSHVLPDKHNQSPALDTSVSHNNDPSPGSDIYTQNKPNEHMSVSTSPGGNSEASSSEPQQCRPRKRMVVRQLSSNPYLASSEMSPSDDHPLIVGSHSYAAGDSRFYANDSVLGTEDSTTYYGHSFSQRSHSYPVTSDCPEEEAEDVDEDDSDENSNDSSRRTSTVYNPPETDNSNIAGSDTHTNVRIYSENSLNQNFTRHPQAGVSPTANNTSSTESMQQKYHQSQKHQHRHHQSKVKEEQEYPNPPDNHQHHNHFHHHQQFFRNSNDFSGHKVSESVPGNKVNGLRWNSNQNMGKSSSNLPDFLKTHHPGNGVSCPPRSREISSWGHFSKVSESHYKYRRSHYSSDSDDENSSVVMRHHSKQSSSKISTNRSQIPSSSRSNNRPSSQSSSQHKNDLSPRQPQNSKEKKEWSQGGMKPHEFKESFQIMKRLFSECNDGQKNIVLKGLLNLCELPQLHLLSVHMSKELHLGCPSNCEDIITWLPTDLATKVMSYLDPVSLCHAAQVCRVWRQLAEDQSLWRRFCCQTKWRLSKAAEHKQVISHMCPEGSIQWKNVFAERYRLRNNWLKGRCTVRTFEGHLQGISCVQFDDSRIVSGSSDKTIKVWNMRTNAPWSVQTLMGHHGTVRCLHLEGNRLVSGSCDTTIKVWDLSTQESWSSIACKVTMTGHSDTVRCLQADDDKVISGSYDKTLKIWDLKSGELRRTLRGHQASVLCVHFSETKIVSGSADKTIKVWNYEGRCMMTLAGHQDAVTCLMFDSTRIVSGSLDHNLKFWDIHTGDCLNTIDWKKAEGHTDVVRCLQADSWRVVSAADDKTIKVWNLATGERLVTLRNHTDGVTCLQFNDFIIVSGSYDKSVKLWDFSCC